jgi:hypothetical protein
MLWIGAPAAGIALGIVAGRQAEEHRLLAEQGADTDALVTRLWRDRGESRQPWVAYRFTSAGRAYEGRAKVSLRVWGKLQPGSRLPLRFLPSSPVLNYPLGREPKPMPPWIPYLVAVALAASGWLATLPVRSQRRLLEEGRPAPALVTRHTKADHGKVAHYEFPLLSGSIAEGKSAASHKPPAIGSTIPVVYDPENPRQNAPYPFSLVRLAHW